MIFNIQFMYNTIIIMRLNAIKLRQSARRQQRYMIKNTGDTFYIFFLLDLMLTQTIS